MMVYKAVCTITLQERGVGYISMSFEDHQDIPPKLSKKDSLYPMGRSPPQCQCLLEGQRSYSNEAMIMQNQLSLGLATVLVIIIIIIVTSFAPISSKIKLSGATKPGD